MWTRFMDMHSGGGQKEKWGYIYIEAPKDEAQIIFYNRFGHNPNRVTCTCCGEDYSIRESETLKQATAYERHCAYDDGEYIEKQNPSYIKYGKNFRYETLAQYLKNEDILVIYRKDIKKQERIGEVPEQGYIWID